MASSPEVRRSGVRPPQRQMNCLSGAVVSAALTPIVWIRTPIARAASAATSGDGLPVLFAPSVMRTTTLAFEGRSLSCARHIVSAVPIAVPSGSMPMSMRPSIRWSRSMSGVSGACRKARPAKMTRPRRSPSRWRVNSPSTRRATMSRLPGLKSPAFMLLEMSSAIMMFRALLRICRTSCGTCGRASATIRSARPSTRSPSGSHGHRLRRETGAPSRNASPGKPMRSSGARRRRRHRVQA
jgi:hypothetical protein